MDKGGRRGNCSITMMPALHMCSMLTLSISTKFFCYCCAVGFRPAFHIPQNGDLKVLVLPVGNRVPCKDAH